MNDWPFTDPKNLAVISLRGIVQDGRPILHVSHDIDGAWQFLEWGTPREDDAMVVSLEGVVLRDSSLKELADLPRGWHALRRHPEDPWTRESYPHRQA